MAGVRPTPQEVSADQQSPLFRKKFGPLPEPGTEEAGKKTDAGMERLSGAERAAAKYLERRAAGVPMGAPQPAKKTA
jgi:hypothetical protein